ncbi:uncharacterized mitochondrial protein AtMg00860-like [Aristolochia californica]|uniref:uncharacterized mitochondrial protein AtMg00860-like n=1 Tax=Aristolochia californica TaxID=171875 RepID=UPI0035E29478
MAPDVEAYLVEFLVPDHDLHRGPVSNHLAWHLCYYAHNTSSSSGPKRQALKHWDEHLNGVFTLLCSHHLVLNKSKCSMGTPEVAYLGHVIFAIGVKVDQSKIQTAIDWPPPISIIAFSGFLGLTGYYRKFIRSYGQIAAPLNNLLKKNAFSWSEPADYSFQQLKAALSSALVLQLPDFDELFVVECDASGGGIGAVLQQQGYLIAYFSR